MTSLLVFNAYRGPITKTGEPIQGDETSNRSVTWHFPLVELLRVGINYINALDRIVDRQGRYWQPESGTTITQNLWGNHVCVNCLSVNPTNSPQPQGTEG